MPSAWDRQRGIAPRQQEADHYIAAQLVTMDENSDSRELAQFVTELAGLTRVVRFTNLASPCAVLYLRGRAILDGDLSRAALDDYAVQAQSFRLQLIRLTRERLRVDDSLPRAA